MTHEFGLECQSKVEARVVDHLSNFRIDGEEYEVMENFAM